jgi:hypothetical protein
VLEAAQRGNDGIEGRPAARGAPGAAVHDQIIRPLGNLRVEVVHQHPKRGFLRPSLAGQRRTPRGADVTADDGHRRMRMLLSQNSRAAGERAAKQAI